MWSVSDALMSDLSPLELSTAIGTLSHLLVIFLFLNLAQRFSITFM